MVNTNLISLLLSIPRSIPSSWETLECRLPSSLAPSPLIIPHESLLNEQPLLTALRSCDQPIFYRDKHGIGPLSQRVWLAFEVKSIEYVTVLTEDIEGTRVQWPDGTIQTDSLEIVQRIQDEYPQNTPDLYPDISMAVDTVNCNILRFKSVFPHNTRPDARIPFQLLPQTATRTPFDPHKVTLEEIDEVLEEYDDGPFFCGDMITAADIAWAPYLERYAVQLPMLYSDSGADLEPRSREYPAIKEWFEAMEDLIPCWACRVMGDPNVYAGLLKEAVEEEGVEYVDRVPKTVANALHRNSYPGDILWNRYASGKPYLAASPAEECAAQLVRNRQTLLETASSGTTTQIHLSKDDVDVALREICDSLINVEDDDQAAGLSPKAHDLVTRLTKDLTAPKDMGMLPLRSLRLLSPGAVDPTTQPLNPSDISKNRTPPPSPTDSLFFS